MFRSDRSSETNLEAQAPLQAHPVPAWGAQGPIQLRKTSRVKSSVGLGEHEREFRCPIDYVAQFAGMCTGFPRV